MKSFLFLLLLAASPFAGAAEFSVYLAPAAAGGTTLAVRDDLHIDVQGKAVPLRLKEARQSIAYPCAAGGTLGFFRVTGQGDAAVREVLASTPVPAGVVRGVVVLAPRDGKLVVTPMWWSASDLRHGSGVFVNLAGRELGLACAGRKLRLLAGRRVTVDAKPAGDAALAPVRVEIFDATGGTDPRRILDQSVAVPRQDTGIYLIVPKQEKYVSLLVLEAAGARDPAARESLKKALAVAEPVP